MRIALLSTSDTDLLSARAADADYALGNPARLTQPALVRLLDGADLVVVRLLGTARAWQDGLDTVLAAGVPVVVLGGEQTPDADLMDKLISISAEMMHAEHHGKANDDDAA